jgi:uncharacterized membrane protein
MPMRTMPFSPGMEASKSARLFAIDALRGLIMVFMALDHANHFIAQKHPQLEMWGGSFPRYASPLAFFTRFVTHLSAPGFFFTMGAGMVLFAHARRAKGWSEWAIMRHFWLRGATLMALQLLLVNRAWEMSLSGWGLNVYIGVLFALGGTMILASLLLKLEKRILVGLTMILFLGMELIHPTPSLWGQLNNDPANLILARPGGNNTLWSNYPILPWMELVVFGMVFGKMLLDDEKKAFHRSLSMGVLFLLAFIGIRSIGGFGNIRPRLGSSWIDYLNVVKYPPSMTFTLLTMGFNLILLHLFTSTGERLRRYLRPLVVLGQAPLFFYIFHLFLYAGLGLWLTPNGTSIAAMYPYWISGLLLLFPFTLWYGSFKRSQPPESMSRFL